jgi:DinB superfamily
LLLSLILNFDILAQQPNQTLSATEKQILITQLQLSLDQFNKAISNLTPEQLNFREKKGKWTIAECIEHITLAEASFPQIVEDEMKKPSNPEFRKKIKIKDEKIRPRMKSRIWRAKSPEIFKPTGKFATPELAIIAFREQRYKTMEYVNNTSDDLRNHFWKHRLTGHIDLYQTLLLMSAHLERHTNQMENIKTSRNFPK